MLVGGHYDPRCPFADKESAIYRLEVGGGRRETCLVNVLRGAGLGQVVVVVVGRGLGCQLSRQATGAPVHGRFICLKLMEDEGRNSKLPSGGGEEFF